jgi:ribose transport system substrate-binding protein
MKRVVILLALFFVAAMAATPVRAGEKLVFAFSFGQSVHPFFIAMEKGAKAKCDELGITFTAISAEGKVETQMANIEDLLQRDVNAIMVNPVDSKALATAAEEAAEKGVPLLTVDVTIENAPLVAHVASDNMEIGRLAARFIAKTVLGGKGGKVAVIELPIVSSTLDRDKGFTEEIAKFPEVKVVAKQAGGHERGKGLDAAENILQAKPDIDVIFGVNEASAMGALSACESGGFDKIRIVGVDTTPDMLAAIKNKTQVVATIAQDPYGMGSTAVELAYKKIKGETVPKYVPVETDVVTLDNVGVYIEKEAAYIK